jgi:hypothetical protein
VFPAAICRPFDTVMYTSLRQELDRVVHDTRHRQGV